MEQELTEEAQTLTGVENDEPKVTNVSKPKKKRRKKIIPRGIDPDDAELLIEAPHIKYITGLRNRLVMEMMLRCGMRVSEVCNLRMKDLKRKENWRVEIRGAKTGDRMVWIPKEMRPLMEIWLDRRSRECPKSEYIFCTTQGTALSRNYVAQMMIRMCERAGIPRTHPHALRHTYAHQFLKKHKNQAALQKSLGHSTPTMTLLYAAAHDDDVERLMTGD